MSDVGRDLVSHNFFKYIYIYTYVYVYIQISLVAQTVKRLYNAGDLGSIPGLGRSPGEGNGSPLQYYCLENPMDRGAWQATVHGVAESQTRLSDFSSHVYIYTHSDLLDHFHFFSPLVPLTYKYLLYPPSYSNPNLSNLQAVLYKSFGD